MDDAELIRELYREYWRCMIAKDENGLRSLMTDDYYLLHMRDDGFVAGIRRLAYFAIIEHKRPVENVSVAKSCFLSVPETFPRWA